MPGRLAAFVYLNDERGNRHGFGPDDEVPAWAAAKISNPKAWAQAPEAEAVDEGQGDGEPQQDDPKPAGAAGDGRPPRNGSREVWAAFAALHGIGLPPDATRDQIIAAVEAAEQ